jgi:hypothetical protein
MIKFDVTNRFTGAVQFTAEIDCAEGADFRVKLGLAVKWAIKTRANLTGANLARANLARAYLTYAYLTGADLTGANLTGANLARANLTDAYLAGARWRDGVVISKRPIQIFGLSPYAVTILDQHMQIGCELHSLAEWSAFDDRRILQMDGRYAATFWAANKDALLSMARAAGRSFDPVVAEAAE